MFRTFYESLIQHPGLLIVLPLASLPFLPRERSFFACYLWFFTLETLLDAWLTSALVRVPSFVPIVFVIAGDLRLFVLLERYAAPASGPWLLRALAASLVVPLAQAAAIALWPAAFAEPRHTFLVYELTFLVWVLAYRRLRLRRAHPDEAVRDYLDGLVKFAATYYGLWALADLWILSPSDAGFALRVVPNVLYYGGFLLFVRGTAPPEVRR